MVYFMENTITGWWLTYPSEKYELVSWGYEIPNIWNVIQNSMVPVTTNQITIFLYIWFQYVQSILP